MNTSFYIARRYLISKSSNNAINVMSFLAAFGVFVSAAALFVVLSGFAGLKDYTLEFVSYASPDLKVEASLGKSFQLSKDDYMLEILPFENIVSVLSSPAIINELFVDENIYLYDFELSFSEDIINGTVLPCFSLFFLVF